MSKTVGIIGAGIAGLALSIRLANQGFAVTVFEKNSYPGGKLSELNTNGFRFDKGPSLFTMPSLIEELTNLQESSHPFEYQKLDVITNYFYSDGTQLKASANLEEFAEEVHLKLKEKITIKKEEPIKEKDVVQEDLKIKSEKKEIDKEKDKDKDKENSQILNVIKEDNQKSPNSNKNKKNKNDIINEDKVTNYLESFPIITSVLMVVGFVFGMVLIVNLVRTIFKYFDFNIQKQQQSVILSYGLLATKSILLNPNKIQIIKITQNYFQKKLDVITIGVHQASSDAKRVKEKDKIEVPGCSQQESFEILKLLFSQMPKKGILYLPNWRKLALNSFFFLLFPIAVMLFLNYQSALVTWNEWYRYATIFSIFSGIIIWFSFKNYKLFVSDDFIIKQNGAWDVDTLIIEPFKIQTIKTQQFFWQKNTNMGSVTLATAGGNISFSTANYTEIKQLVNYWLYQVATSNKNWM